MVFLAIPSSNIFYGISKNRQQRFRNKNDFEKQQEDIFATLNYVKTVDLAALNRLFDRSKTIYCYPTGFPKESTGGVFQNDAFYGKRVIVLPNKTEFDMVMPMITAEDCVIIASLSGETENVKENLTTFAIRRFVLTLSAPGDIILLAIQRFT